MKYIIAGIKDGVVVVMTIVAGLILCQSALAPFDINLLQNILELM